MARRLRSFMAIRGWAGALQYIEALPDPASHPGMQRPIPGFLGSELLEQIQCGESGLLPERGGDQRFAGVPGIIELFGADEVIRSLNFPIGPRHTHVETLRFFTPEVAVAAPDAEVDLTDGERPARSDSQPAFHQFWFGIRSPNKAARSVEGARNQDGGIALGCHGQHVHLSVCRSASRFAKLASQNCR